MRAAASSHCGRALLAVLALLALRFALRRALRLALPARLARPAPRTGLLTRPAPRTGLLASGGVDSTILIWTPESLENKKPAMKTTLAHSSGGINALAFVSDDKLASAGADACIKFWKI